ncbi:hypothetical protein [Lacisediminimonas profundi]|uniref:hypothetical protein n=1 Tax=Lacisediminimonas profundi TaxID=2603856 RepID=UPI0019D5D85D|nr:hypothetical protein [Lacisediminimonas profundi]
MDAIKENFQSNLEKREILKFRFPGPDPRNVRSPMPNATDNTGQATPASNKKAGNRVSWAPSGKLAQERTYQVPANTKRSELDAKLEAALKGLGTTPSSSTAPKGMPRSSGKASAPQTKAKVAQLEADALLALDHLQADLETTELDRELKELEDQLEQPVAAQGSTNSATASINNDGQDLDAELDGLEAMLPSRQESLGQKIDQLLAPLVGHMSKPQIIAAKGNRPSTAADDLKEIDDLIGQLEGKPDSSKRQAAPAKASKKASLQAEDELSIHPDVEVSRAEVLGISARHHNIFKGEKIGIKAAAAFARELSEVLTAGHVRGASLIAGEMRAYVAKAEVRHRNVVPAAEIKRLLDAIMEKLQ